MTAAKSMRHGYHDLPRREVLALIPTTAKKVLDLGCGTGALGKALKERQQCHVTGIELNKDALEIAKTNLDTCICDNLNRYDFSLTNVRWDCIVLADILEHLVNPWLVIKKATKALTDDGCIIASFPNVAHPNVSANLQRGLFRYEPAGLLDITHLRFFTKTSIFQMFYGAGLKITKCDAHPSADNPIQYHITATKPRLVHKNPQTTILILTHNQWQYTKMCIDSIKRKTQTPYKILVVDNGSTDETVKALRHDPTIYHIENTHNLGFAAGFNVGLYQTDTPYFVLCNSDVVVTPGWLHNMIFHIASDEKLLLLGARSNHVSGPQIVKNVPYKNDTELDTYAKTFTTNRETPLTYFHRIVFFFTLFKREALHKVGFLDEIFGKGNFEDDDYCLRLAKKGFKAAYDNTVFIHHYGSRGFMQNPNEYRALLEKNKKLFLAKHGITDCNCKQTPGAV